jgi:hypothetical protein
MSRAVPGFLNRRSQNNGPTSPEGTTCARAISAVRRAGGRDGCLRPCRTGSGIADHPVGPASGNLHDEAVGALAHRAAMS